MGIKHDAVVGVTIKQQRLIDRDLIDDHAPLNAIGIPTIDIIDFDYPSWHTAEDTIDKISAQSLQIVGSVALFYVAEFGLKQ